MRFILFAKMSLCRRPFPLFFIYNSITSYYGIGGFFIMNDTKKKIEEKLASGAFLGAIVGDIVGSVYEWDNIKTKEFLLFSSKCLPTDDSIMTLAIAKALLECNGSYVILSQKAIDNMRLLGALYPHAGYGGRFSSWLKALEPKPYNSFGNGSAMRVSAVAYFADSIEQVKELSYKVTAVTHNHIEGIKGAEATAVAVYMALQGSSMQEIKDIVIKDYYPMDFTLDEIKDTYRFNETCQNTVPQALEAFFESTGFEDAIRNAISIGGDSDTLAAITGAIAGAYYGVPEEIKMRALSFLDNGQKDIYISFVNNFSQ